MIVDPVPLATLEAIANGSRWRERIFAFASLTQEQQVFLLAFPGTISQVAGELLALRR